MTRIFNFSGHPLTPETRIALQEKLSEEIFVIDSKVHIDFRENIYTQIKDLIAPYKTEMTKGKMLIIPPSMNTIAVLLISYVHGVIGMFPSIITLKMTGTHQSLSFITDLNRLRKEGREARY